MANTPEGTPYVESSDLVANYPAASLALANRVDLVGVLPFADAAARTTAISSPTDGQYSYLQDTNSTEFWNGSAWQAVAGGKILQMVRATDSTQRTTTSTSFVDASISVTITPQKSTSAILLIWSQTVRVAATHLSFYQITDSSNNGISGAQQNFVGTLSNLTNLSYSVVSIAYATPGTTSATTYKGRFKTEGGTTTIFANENTSQLYAIEVSA